MNETALARAMQKSIDFIIKGSLAMVKVGAEAPEHYLISACPVSTAIAAMALMSERRTYGKKISKAVAYLNEIRNADGGWGYEDPMTEALSALRAMGTYKRLAASTSS